MDFFWEMLSLQETLFLLILLGVLVKKLKIIRENGRKTLSDLLIYAILPCNIVASFMGGITLPDGFVHNCILAVCISIGIQVLSIYGSKLLFRFFFQLAGGQLPQLLLHGVAELAHHADGAVLKVGHDAGSAVVVDHLAGGGLSIFQKGGILGQGDHPALEQHLTCERLFKMCSVHRICVLSR